MSIQVAVFRPPYLPHEARGRAIDMTDTRGWVTAMTSPPAAAETTLSLPADYLGQLGAGCFRALVHRVRPSTSSFRLGSQLYHMADCGAVTIRTDRPRSDWPFCDECWLADSTKPSPARVRPYVWPSAESEA
jgi:hypothetical protein